ncbi:MAG: hypothetical protein NTZ55_01100 [Candidatus Roizmanbacteria bacterium]|nr:hypothetical protein [Candidatus Roizmanbacteria bacterium]
MKKPLMLGGLILVCLFGIAVLNSQKQNDSQIIKSIEPTIKQDITPTVPVSRIVPLPQETDIIRTFFHLIEERKISEAVMMMSDQITSDDSTKQAWGVQLNSIQSVKVVDIVSSMPEEWKADKHTYQVTLELTMNPSSQSAPIPYYGYENGRNIRWMTLNKVGTLWKIDGIATGP